MPIHDGLPVAGYRPQSEDAVELMAVNRSIFQPSRVTLPDDKA